MAGQYIANLYDQMENEVVADIARRVKKTNRFTETAEIQAKVLRAQGYSPAKIQAEVMKRLNADNDYLQFVAENTRAYKQEVKELIKETVAQAVIDGDALIAAAGDMAWNDDLQVWADHGVDLKKDNTLRQFQKAFTEQTVGELKNITRTTALQVAGVPILDAYHHELDLAVLKVASGSFSFTQAMEDCCRRLGSNGVAVIYPSGKKYSLEAATRMTMKTGLSQLAGKVTEHNLEKTGTALVYVSAHAGARPEHAEWQGKVYTYTGKPSKKYPDFYEATGYGTLTGLKGVNCSHEFYPHWEGDPIPEFREPDPVTVNGKDYTFYEATQEQRKMERQVRNMKREQAAAEAAGDQKKAAELEAKIRATRQEYGQFSQQAGLRAKYERMGIFDGNNSGGSKMPIIAPPEIAKAIKKVATVQEAQAAPVITARPTVSGKIKGISKKGTDRQDWIVAQTGMTEAEAKQTLKAIGKYTNESEAYSLIHNGKDPETTAVLDNFIKNPGVPIYDGTIYRGVHIADVEGLTAEEAIEAICKTGKWNEPGITSFADNRRKAAQFATGPVGGDGGASGVNVLIKCDNNKSGVPIQHLTAQRPEGEVLVPSDIADRGYTITKYKRRVETGRTVPYIDNDGEWKERPLPDRIWYEIEVKEND